MNRPTPTLITNLTLLINSLHLLLALTATRLNSNQQLNNQHMPDFQLKELLNLTMAKATTPTLILPNLLRIIRLQRPHPVRTNQQRVRQRSRKASILARIGEHTQILKSRQRHKESRQRERRATRMVKRARTRQQQRNCLKLLRPRISRLSSTPTRRRSTSLLPPTPLMANEVHVL